MARENACYAIETNQGNSQNKILSFFREGIFEPEACSEGYLLVENLLVRTPNGLYSLKDSMGEDIDLCYNIRHADAGFVEDDNNKAIVIPVPSKQKKPKGYTLGDVQTMKMFRNIELIVALHEVGHSRQNLNNLTRVEKETLILHLMHLHLM